MVTEAWEKHWEEWKRLEEEKVQLVMATKLAAEQAAELAVDREWRILLQVSLSFLWLELEVQLQEQRDLEVSVMMLELLLAPFTDKGKEVSSLFFGSGVQN